MAVDSKPALDQEDQATVDNVAMILSDFAEWLADGAGKGFDEVFAESFMDDDPRSWRELSMEFLHMYAERLDRMRKYQS